MNILSQLSSQKRDRTEASNRKVAIQCSDDPLLLEQIAEGLKSTNAALVGDCAEIFSMVGQDYPDEAAPYGPALLVLLEHKNTRVRWEAAHALSYITTRIPEEITPFIITIAQMIERDPSVIFRDYSTDILSSYAATGAQAARLVYPHLIAALTLWEGKHAAHALPGLVQTAAAWPDLRAEIQTAIEPLLASPKGVVRAAARKALKTIPA